MLARALAGETGAAFIPSAASSFVTKWVGSGPQAVRDLFDAGRRYAPSIVFIDEVDSIGLERHGSEGSGRAEEETLNALLTEMDGFVGQDPARPVIVVAATNADIGERRGSRRALDPALVRRFSASVLVDLPSKAARALFLTRRLEGTAVSSGAIEAIADQTYGRTIADLQAIVDRAVRRQGRGEWVELGDQDLQDALGWWEHGDRRESWGPEMERRTAFHEAGHTLLYWLSSGRVPALVTVVPRGEHGGFMQRTTEDMEQPLRTREQLLGDLRVALGGRAAEALYAEKVLGVSDGLSTGAAGDLAAARRLARAYVTRYGMDEELGVTGVLTDDELASPPKEVLDRVGALLREAEGSAESDLGEKWEQLEALAQALLVAGSLSGEGLKAVLDPGG